MARPASGKPLLRFSVTEDILSLTRRKKIGFLLKARADPLDGRLEVLHRDGGGLLAGGNRR